MPPLATARATLTALSTLFSATFAAAKKASPAGVNRAGLLSSLISFTPRSLSKARICRLNGGWETCRRAAARVMLDSSATATK